MPSETDAIASTLDQAGWQRPQPMKSGGTALVFKAIHPRTGKPVAIKVLRPSLAKKQIKVIHAKKAATKAYREFFADEIQTLSRVSHRSVMEILDVGDIVVGSESVPYFVMPFLDGACDFYEYCRHRPWSKMEPLDSIRSFSSLCIDVLQGLQRLHELGILHRDVKGENVIVDASGHARLTDFGGAKEITRRDGSTISIQDVDYLHPELRAFLEKEVTAFSDQRRVYLYLPRNLLRAKGVFFDLYAFGVTLSNVTETIAPHIPEDTIRFLKFTAVRLKRAGTRETPRYSTAVEVISDLRKADRTLGLGSVVEELSPTPRHTLRLAPALGVPVSDGVKAIIDTAIYRRLRHFKQLALVHYVYPSAQHTRFEHSLGVYHWAREYVNALWHDPGDSYVRAVARESDVRALLVGALLHDLGQYPFAHAAEGVHQDWFSHDSFGRLLLDEHHEEHRRLPVAVRRQVKELEDVIRKHFRGVEPALPLAILRSTPPSADLGIDSEIQSIFHSVLDGPIDADKADYTLRDALFAGITAASPATDALFLQSLTVSSNHREIALRASGRDAAESLILLRYRLFKWVYWHRTVRGIESLLMDVIDAIRRTSPEPRDWAWRFKLAAFGASEASLLEWLVREAKRSRIDPGYIDGLEGIASRRLYQRVLTLSPIPTGREKQRHQERELYDQLLRLKDNWYSGYTKDLDNTVEKFRARLAAHTKRSMDPSDIVVDIPIPKRHDVKDLRIADPDRGDVSIRDVSHVWRSIPVDFEELARRVRVFAKPDIAGVLTEDLVYSSLLDAV